MDFFESLGFNMDPLAEQRKHDNEICARCNHTRTAHNSMYQDCHECDAFVPSGRVRKF